MLTVSDSEIREIVKSLYGMTVSRIERLHGFEDINVHFRTNQDRSGIEEERDYVLKLSTKTSVNQIELQHKTMTLLSDSGISTCTPVTNIHNTTTCCLSMIHDKQEVTVVAHTLTFLPGHTMHAIGNPMYLMEDVGKLAGRVDQLLQNIEVDWINVTSDSLWQFDRLPSIRDLLHDYCEPGVLTVAREVINAYNKHIVQVLDTFQKGPIHGDMNDCNILVKSTVNTSGVETYRVSGLIDYGDMCYGYYVYELATLIADLISSTPGMCPLDVARQVVLGYQQEFELLQSELDCLQTVICVRLLQYYVLTGVAIRKDPSNDYVVRSRDEYLAMLKYLWSVDEARFRKYVLF